MSTTANSSRSGNALGRRQFFAALGGGALAAAGMAQSPRTRPNIIVILADDMGYGDLSCYGSTRIKTPNIDRLAAEGMRFTDFHSSGAVCSPTRAGLLTGRYQQRCGIAEVVFAAGPRDKGLDPAEVTFPRQLKKAGYATALFGKWHLGYMPKFNPVKHGFDKFRGYVSGNVDYFSHVDQAGHEDWWDGDKLSPEEGYSTDLINRHGARFIEENRGRPFCLYLAHEAPHSPFQGPNDKPERKVGVIIKPQGSRKDVEQAYKEMVERMDHGIGEVMEALKRNNLERDTLVFFFSDNGGTKVGSNGRLRGHKGSVWEGGHRVPGIARWPGRIRPGSVCNDTAISLDLFPTMLSIADAPPAGRKLDGVDLMPALTGSRSLRERTLFWGYNRQRAMRQGKWKLVVNVTPEMPGPYLFDLSVDPGEKNDLAAKDPTRVHAMQQALAAWEKDVGA